MNCHSGEICSGLGGDQNVIGRNSGPGNGRILIDNFQIRSPNARNWKEERKATSAMAKLHRAVVKSMGEERTSEDSCLSSEVQSQESQRGRG